jgi:hypothetical protein
MLNGPVPERAHGSPEQLRQLITLLGVSLREFERTESFALQISFERKQHGHIELILSVCVGSSNCDDLNLRLTALVKASSSLQTLRSGGPELKFAAACQLALAAGAGPSIDVTEDRKVRVRVSLPLGAVKGSDELEKLQSVHEFESSQALHEPYLPC